jgi:hypothetical protein
MKELSIEEKAKRYDEAIEELRGLLEGIHEEKCEILEEDITDIFPELKESEDERIRKEIIEAFKTLGDGKIPVVINYADIFTWLEKQDNANKEYWRGYREGKKEILDKYSELEKQGEQKSWNEEDKRMFDYALDMIEWYGGKNEKRVRLVSDWLKSLKQRIG